uniref:Tyrosine-protein phosphatase domain-containing protein n=1 Tax=Panagrolaimus sp. JU765 TaxID=591449 RepID=A0AC34QYQ7_9BILA
MPSTGSLSTSSRRRKSDSNRRRDTRDRDDLAVEPVRGRNIKTNKTTKKKTIDEDQIKTDHRELDRDKPATPEQKTCFEQFARDTLAKGINGILSEYMEQLVAYTPPGVQRRGLRGPDPSRVETRFERLHSRQFCPRRPVGEHFHLHPRTNDGDRQGFLEDDRPGTGWEHHHALRHNRSWEGKVSAVLAEGRRMCRRMARNSSQEHQNRQVRHDDSGEHVGGGGGQEGQIHVEAPSLEDVARQICPGFSFGAISSSQTGAAFIKANRRPLQCRNWKNWFSRCFGMLEMVKWLRAQRMSSVQTDLQYLYLYKCLITFACKYKLIPADLTESLAKFDEEYQRLIDDRTKQDKPELYAPLVFIKK